MSSIREQIAAAALTALNTSRPGGIPIAVRLNTKSIGSDALPAIALRIASDAVHQLDPNGPIVARTLTLEIDCMAKGTALVTADTAVDPLTAWTLAALKVDQTLGGLANSIDEQGTAFDYQQDDYQYCKATVTYAVEYQSNTNNAESRT